jgi:methionyl aminopeptidase
MLARKAPIELAHMRAAGRIVEETLQAVATAAQPGVRLIELDALAAELIAKHGAKSSFLGYHPTWAPAPYPAVLCLSVNDTIVHGIPDARRLRSGDLLSIDFAVSVDGYHADAAITVGVGKLDATSQRIADTAEEALAAGIAAAEVGARLGDVSHAIERVIRSAGFGTPVGYGGHGIGRAMHEDPHVPNTGRPGTGLRLCEGLVVAIEPMVIAGGSDANRRADNGWAVLTSDGSRAAHAEHTVAIQTDGPVVLTTA